MAHKIGKRTMRPEHPPVVAGFASVVSQKEGEGPLKEYFDEIETDSLFGQKSWEQAESVIQKRAANRALKNAGMTPADMDAVFAGDLLNQCIGSTFGLRDLEIPFVGLYGACSTMAEALCVGSIFLDSGAAANCLCLTSSHFCSSERQFRFPLEYASLRTPTSQWTVTGGGAVVLSATGSGIRVREVTVGKILDPNITDANNMGAAMAPAAADTVSAFLADTGTSPADYDGIFTGDLGRVGGELFCQLMEEQGIFLRNVYRDCGVMMFPPDMKDVYAGGSGCGCSASVLCSFLLKEMQNGRFKNILFAATGALLSPTSSMQGESIPGISHLVHLSAD